MPATTQPQNATSGAAAQPAAGPPSPPLPIDGPKIVNIVCGVNLNCIIDLKSVALHAMNTQYQPKRLQAVVLRQKDPKATAMVFASGKMQVLGAKSVDNAKLAARRFARMIQKIGFAVHVSDFNVQNIVSTVDLKYGVRLEGLQHKHHRFASYEPEIFPGLMYRMLQPRVTFLIFANGKMSVLGAKKEADIEQGIKLLYPVLKEFAVRKTRTDVKKTK